MTNLQTGLIDRMAEQLELDADELLLASLDSYLHSQLRRVEADITSLQVKYQVQTAREIDQRYTEGTLPEEGTWEDYFRLDHLEYKRRQLQNALTVLDPKK